MPFKENVQFLVLQKEIACPPHFRPLLLFHSMKSNNIISALNLPIKKCSFSLILQNITVAKAMLTFSFSSKQKIPILYLCNFKAEMV